MALFTVSVAVLVFASVFYHPIAAQASTASTANIGSYPLAVRNPYLSAWLPSDISHDAPTAAPQFWAGQTLYWPVFARVGGTTYYLLSEVDGVKNALAATQQSIEFTATHTIINLVAANASVTMDFFSPISPDNYIRQSLPYSYLTVNVSSPSATPVQIFTGWDESWCGFSGSLNASVQTAPDGQTVYFNISDPGQTLYAEKNNMAAWGSFVAGSKPAPAATMTWEYAARSTVQQGFVKSGVLNNTATSYTSGNVFAITHDFGTTTNASATYAVGFDRTHAINFTGTSYSGFYRSQYPEPASAVPAFLADYAAAYDESLAFDARVVSAGSAFSTNYTDLLQQSARQTYGAMEIVIPTSTLDTSSPLAFLKEISSDGDISTVDVIFPSFPALYLISPDWLRLLCEPYLIYINSGNWPRAYIPHDLGNYPQAVGHNYGGGEQVLVEATGPFFTLLYAYMHATGADDSFLALYRAKLIEAGDWLANPANGLYPPTQLSTVDAIAATANQTGLAMAAAVGLKALGAALGLANYTAAGDSFASAIDSSPGLGLDVDGSAATHLTYNYGLNASWVTPFHLFPDALLGLSTFPSSVAAMEASWLSARFADLASISGGVQYSGQVDFQISEWIMWAGAVCDKYAPAQGIGALATAAVHQFVTNGLNNVPMPTKFVVSGTGDLGTYVTNKARPTVGSVWALLALNGKW